MNSNKHVIPPLQDDVKANLQKFADRQQGNTEKKNNQVFPPSDHFEISIVTPTFGGSPDPGKVNTRTPVRVSSVRGNLRFWWRASVGASFRNVKDLRKREVQIFGDAGTPSSVKLWIEDHGKPTIETANKVKQPTKDHAPIRYVFKPEYPVYVTFPFSEDKPVQTVTSHRFTLHINYQGPSVNLGEDEFSSIQQELRTALWAWINFGGIGSRTRRGCGSLYSSVFSPSEGEDIGKWYTRCIQQYKLELHSSSSQWPTLPDTISYQGTMRTSKEAWLDIIKIYQDFRQHRNGRMGRSFWPEADALRMITRMSQTDHKERYPRLKGDFIAFPRAEFGLPIIYQFKGDKPDKKEDLNTRDPYTIQVTPRKANRLSSPLILKALAVSPFKAHSIAIKLNTLPLDSIKLEISDSKARNYNHKNKINASIQSHGSLESGEIYKELSYDKSPYKGYTSAIEAFMQGVLKGERRWKESPMLESPEEHEKNPQDSLSSIQLTEQANVNLELLESKFKVRRKK